MALRKKLKQNPKTFLVHKKEETIFTLKDVLTSDNNNGQLPRDDYKETVELTLLMLGEIPPG